MIQSGVYLSRQSQGAVLCGRLQQPGGKVILNLYAPEVKVIRSHLLENTLQILSVDKV
jgi:hypothetical protein